MRKIVLAFVLIATIIFTNSLAFADVLKGGQSDNGLKFADISKHWASDSINRIADKDIFGGKDGKFQPNKPITRSEFVLMLHKALDIHIAYFKAPDIKEFFDDVNNEAVYADDLYDLATLGIIDGKGHFNPNGLLSREEMVHYIMNAYKYKMGGDYAMIMIAPMPFADDKKLDPSYSGDVARAEILGIIKRPANNMFYPKQNATRAEAATVIDRLVTQFEKVNPQVQVTPGAELKDGILTAKLTIVNNTGKQITIDHTSGQKFDFQLLDSNREVLYTWSADKMFIMALTKTVIEPGKSIEFSGTFDKALMDGFNGKAAYVRAYIVGQSNDFTINPKGYETEIK